MLYPRFAAHYHLVSIAITSNMTCVSHLKTVELDLMFNHGTRIVDTDDTHSSATTLTHWAPNTDKFPVEEDLIAGMEDIDGVDLLDRWSAQGVLEILGGVGVYRCAKLWHECQSTCPAFSKLCAVPCVLLTY